MTAGLLLLGAICQPADSSAQVPASPVAPVQQPAPPLFQAPPFTIPSPPRSPEPRGLFGQPPAPPSPVPDFRDRLWTPGPRNLDGLPQKALNAMPMVCTMRIIPMDPNIDPQIYVGPREDAPEYRTRLVPPGCQASHPPAATPAPPTGAGPR
jgi:hypothetical protein